MSLASAISSAMFRWASSRVVTSGLSGSGLVELLAFHVPTPGNFVSDEAIELVNQVVQSTCRGEIGADL